MSDSWTIDERIDRLRQWVDATSPGATTELDREIVEALFEMIDEGIRMIERVEQKAITSESGARDIRLVVWAIIRACGGEVKVPREILDDKPIDAAISRDTEKFTDCYVFKAK